MTSPSNLTVAAYTIVKNEAAHAQRWADSMRAAGFDILFWLDTGSTDDTVAVARAAGINVIPSSVNPFRFDDARNTALYLLPAAIDYCLSVDADMLVDPLPWREEMAAVGFQPRYAYKEINDAPGYWSQAMHHNFHARHGFRWKYPIHEIIVGPAPTATLTNLVIHHQPDPTKDRSSYLPMLKAATQEMPDDPRMQFYYARELYFHNDWVSARTEFEKFLAMPSATWKEERCEALRHMAEMVYEPEPWLLRAVAEAPNRREPWVDLARLYFNHGKTLEARGAFAAAERRTDSTLYAIASVMAWGEKFEQLRDYLFEPEPDPGPEADDWKAVIPTRNERPEVLRELVTTISPARCVIVHTIDSFGSPDIEGAINVRFDGPLNIHSWWNEGIRTAASRYVAIVNDDTRLLHRTIPDLVRACNARGATVAKPVSQDIYWDGFLFILDTSHGLLPDERFRWHAGDNDLFLRANKVGKGVLDVPVTGVKHLEMGLGDTRSPALKKVLEEFSHKDKELFQSLWGDRALVKDYYSD